VDHGEAITAYAVRADGRRIVTAGDNFAKLWSADGKPVAELRGNRYAREFADLRDRALQVETGNGALSQGCRGHRAKGAASRP